VSPPRAKALGYTPCDDTQVADDRISASTHQRPKYVAKCRNGGISPPVSQNRDNSLTKIRMPSRTIVNESSTLSHNIVGWLD
jgi:hypothetical protein